jgi:hypothetical protein
VSKERATALIRSIARSPPIPHAPSTKRWLKSPLCVAGGYKSPGKKVTVRAELVEVDGRKLRFKVEAQDEDKKVGEGTHRRAIIAVQRAG